MRNAIPPHQDEDHSWNISRRVATGFAHIDIGKRNQQLEILN